MDRSSWRRSCAVARGPNRRAEHQRNIIWLKAAAGRLERGRMQANTAVDSLIADIPDSDAEDSLAEGDKS